MMLGTLFVSINCFGLFLNETRNKLNIVTMGLIRTFKDWHENCINKSKEFSKLSLRGESNV